MAILAADSLGGQTHEAWTAGDLTGNIPGVLHRGPVSQACSRTPMVDGLELVGKGSE